MAEKNLTEKQAKEKVKKLIDLYAKYNNIYTFCPMTFGYGESGHPDRVVVINGRYIGIEIKKDENNHHCRPELKAKPNEVAQKRQKEKIIKAGGDWICVHNNNLLELATLLDQRCNCYSMNFKSSDWEQYKKLTGL